ncbi:hypothetical protein [Edaphobacter acidisoli]|uniref:hypothetical protein n=1 Tax=Edaphobacter acidisoli TaxID=2040573 RepID=UPI001666AF34|nr:hypothetical protein [Edaphobacter acidisoli]
MRERPASADETPWGRNFQGESRFFVNMRKLVENGWTLERIEEEVRLRAVSAAVACEEGHCQKAATRLGVHRNTISRLRRPVIARFRKSEGTA